MSLDTPFVVCRCLVRFRADSIIRERARAELDVPDVRLMVACIQFASIV